MGRSPCHFAPGNWPRGRVQRITTQQTRDNSTMRRGSAVSATRKWWISQRNGGFRGGRKASAAWSACKDKEEERQKGRETASAPAAAPPKPGQDRGYYFRAAQAYMLISMPTGTSTIFGVFQVIRGLFLALSAPSRAFKGKAASCLTQVAAPCAMHRGSGDLCLLGSRGLTLHLLVHVLR